MLFLQGQPALQKAVSVGPLLSMPNFSMWKGHVESTHILRPSQPALFFHHIVPQVRPTVCQCTALEPEILWKRWFAWAFREHVFFVMPFSHESEHIKLITTSLIINLSLAAVISHCSPHLPVSSACFFCEPPPWFSVCYSGHANRSGPIVFERSLCWQHGPSSILPSCALPGLAQTRKYWTKIQRLPNQDHISPLFVQCFGFRIQS